MRMGPTELMLFCLRFAGMMPMTGGILNRLYSIYLFSTFFVFGTSLTLYVATDPKPIMGKLKTFHYMIAATQIFCKFLSILLNQKETKDILDTVELLSNDAYTDPMNRPVLDRVNKLIRRVVKIFMFFYAAYYPLRLTNLLVKYLLFHLKKPQLFLEGSWIPPVLERTYVYGLLYQLLTTLSIGFTNSSYSCLIVYLTLQVSAQLQVLSRLLEDGTSPVRQCVILHQKVMRLFLRTNRLLIGQMFVEMVLTSIYSCICGFLIIRSMSGKGGDVGNNANVLILVMMRSILICYCGNIILKQGEKLHTAAYAGQWYKRSPSDQKAVLFILALTKAQPFKYNYRNILTIDMEQFMKSVNTTYSYLTMLLSFSEH